MPISNFLIPLVGSILLSLVSFAGVATFSLAPRVTKRLILSMVGLAAGALLAVSFLDLIPEGIEVGGTTFLAATLATVIIYLILEKTLHLHHAHGGHSEIHAFGYMNLVGDMIHNFLDGLVLVAAYSINHALGLTTLLAIALHEIPRELGDYGVLVHAGFSPRKAAWLNFSTSIFSALGVVVGSLLSSSVGSISLWLLPVAAGSFLYVGMSDLLPMLREGDEGKSFPWEVLMVVLGAFLVGGVGMFLGV